MLGTLAIAIGSVAVLGWWIDHQALAQTIPPYAGMTFNTALNFILMGTALLISSRQKSIAGLVTVFAGLVLLQDLTGVNFGIDRLFYAYDGFITTSPYPGRMAPTTASCFILISLTLIVIRRSHSQLSDTIAETFTSMVFGYGLVNAFLRIIFPETPQAIAHFASMSLFTSIGFMVVSTGVWFTFRRIYADKALTPFTPAVNFMSRVKLTHKFILISFIIVIPLVIGMGYLISDIGNKRTVAMKQQQGLAYISPLLTFFELVPQHRGLLNAYLHGEHSLKDQIIAKREEISTVIQVIDAVDKTSGDALLAGAKWGKIRHQWLGLLDYEFDISIRDSWRAHTSISHETIAFIQHLLSTSRLAAETENGTQHLAKTLFEYILPAVEATAQIRGLGSGIATSKTFDDELKYTLRERATNLSESLYQAHSFLRLAFVENNELEALLGADIEKSMVLASRYLTTLEVELLRADKINIDAVTFFNQGTEAIDESLRLFSTGYAYLVNGTEMRADGIEVSQYFLILAAFFGVVFFCYIFIAFYLAILRSISILNKTASKLLEGDLNAGVLLYKVDEMESAVESLQNIANAISATSSRAKSIVDNAIDGLIMTDDQGLIEAFNPAAENLFGHSSAEILGGNISALMHDSSLPDLNQQMKAAGKGTLEETGQRKDKSTFPMEMTTNAFLTGPRDNRRTKFIFELCDITERKQAEEEIRENVIRYSNIVNLAFDAVISIDAEQCITVFNEAAEKIFGYSRDEVLGKQLEILLPEHFREQHRIDVEHFSEGGRISPVMAGPRGIVGLRKNGQEFSAEASISEFSKSGKRELTVFLRDVSASRALEEQLRQAQKMEALGTLVGGIAHDFNNILASIIGSLFLAKCKSEDRPEIIQDLKNIEALSFRARDTISQLLTFARKDAVDMHPLMLTPFIKEASKLAMMSVPKNIKVRTHFCAEVLRVNGDATQMQQVLMNLLSNARHAVEDVDKPEINMELAVFEADDNFEKTYPDLASHRMAKLTVSDNGQGIPDEHLNNIFDPFFTTKEVGAGTGLGLAMVYGAVASHGGVMQVESEVSKGTSFHIYLPLLEPEHEPETDVANAEETMSGHGETILLVDDEESVLSTTAKVLERLGYKVLAAVDGEEALKLFQTHKQDIDLVLTDIVMPKMGGLNLASAIREINENVPIIFATGYDKEHETPSTNSISHSIMANKPFSIVHLSQSIRKMIKPDLPSPQ